MSQSKRYDIVVTKTALTQIEEKFDYIAKILFEPASANKWILRLIEFLRKNLSFFPKKYPLFYEKKYKEKYRVVRFRNDIVIYSIDNDKNVVYIKMICTNGKNLSHLLELYVSEDE